jgi:hypothetical protein
MIERLLLPGRMEQHCGRRPVRPGPNTSRRCAEVNAFRSAASLYPSFWKS